MLNSYIKVSVCFTFLFCAVFLLGGCTATKGGGYSDTLAQGISDDSAGALEYRAQRYLEAQDDEALQPNVRSKILRTAKSQIGTPYVLGGTQPGGFDCSGFVQWTYNQVGVKLPRTAREQSRFGRPVKNTNELQVGDIVAFKHPRRGYHTGIYVGDGKFIHSPRKRTTIRINSLTDPYFSTTYLGARRVASSSSEADLERAEEMFAEYTENKKKSRNTVVTKKSSSKKKKSVSKSSSKKQQIASKKQSSRKTAPKATAKTSTAKTKGSKKSSSTAQKK